MKKLIKQIIIEAVRNANHKKILPFSIECPIEIEETKSSIHGDFSTNLALQSAKVQKMLPIIIAKIIINEIDLTNNILKEVRIAKPGFINFFIKPYAWHSILKKIHKENHKYGHSTIGLGKYIQIEFVSSNPTGPLHIGHGRGAVLGDTMANIMFACGFIVQKEYYINDSGKQIYTLGLSVYLRAKTILKHHIKFPKECYQGDYIKTLAKNFIEQEGPSFFNQDREKVINKCSKYASEKIIDQIRQDLNELGINFDSWFSEQSLYTSGKVKTALEYYRNEGFIYEKDGAHWFKTSKFGDEKDRVVVRKNGRMTYFASDIAYHKNKFERGFDQIINVWGADHHGYIPRIKAVVEAAKRDRDQLKIILVKLVNLSRNKKPIAMSTRSGDFITLSSVVKEVGSDAARFLFLTRHHESSLDFDIELAKKKSNDNPVYYVQYVHARISSILIKGEAMGINNFSYWDKMNMKQITSEEEINLMKKMSAYPQVIKNACYLMEPHRIAFYLIELASNFHAYYNRKRILSDDLQLTRGRLYLTFAVQKVIYNGLKLLGVSTPETM